MQRIIQRSIKETVDLKQLAELIPKYAVVKKYDQLKGNTLKDVMGNKTVLIVLWNIHDKKHRTLNKPGHFWVISTRGPEKSPVVFSSTGMSYKKELFITQSDPTLLERILPANTIYNTTKLQINDDSNTCWRYCLLFCYFSKLGLKQFVSLFSRPHVVLQSSDQLATALTLMTLF